MKKKLLGILVCTLMIFATVLPVAGNINVNENKIINNIDDTAVFIAHFMTPEGDPHPADVIISDGTWREEWKNISYLNASVPLQATYTIYYHTYSWESYRHHTFNLSPGEIFEIEYYIYNVSQIEVARPYFLYKEVDAEANLSWNWDPEEGNLSWTIYLDPPDKKTHVLWYFNTNNGPYYYDPNAPIDWDYILDELMSNQVINPCWKESDHSRRTTRDVDRCWRIESHGEEGAVRSGLLEYTSYCIHSERDSDLGTIRIGYGLYNDAIMVYPIETTLRGLDGTYFEENHFDPQYVVPLNNYILEINNLSEEYASLEYPINMDVPKGISINNFYLPKMMELGHSKFFVAAESCFSHSSYSDLLEDPDQRLITVNVSTETVYDWWGCFVLPDNLAVDTLTAYKNEKPFELNRWYNYTINRVEGYNLVVVRIDENTTSLQLKYIEDPTPPILEKTEPKGIYLFDRKIIPLPFDFAFAIGKVTLSTEATDNESDIGCVEFYIDDELKYRIIDDPEEPYDPYYYIWKGPPFGMHTIKMIAHDNAENTATKEIKVLKFL